MSWNRKQVMPYQGELALQSRAVIKIDYEEEGKGEEAAAESN